MSTCTVHPRIEQASRVIRRTTLFSLRNDMDIHTCAIRRINLFELRRRTEKDVNDQNARVGRA